MPAPSTNALLSFGDALFLYLEREGIPLNVASVTVLEGTVTLEHLRQYLEAKAAHIPRFHQRVVTPPFNVGLPQWEDDAFFDIVNHVHETTLKHGTEKELKSVASKILSQTLDRRRPLWDMVLVHGLKGNRTGLVIRIHHALADGVSGVGLLHQLLDTTPDAPHPPKHKVRPPEPQPQRDPLSMMVDGIVSTCMYATERVLNAQAQMMTVAQHIVAALGPALGTALAATGEKNVTDGAANLASTFASAMPSLDQLGELLPELASATSRLPFNTICYGPQNFRWAEVPLADIKAVKNACGVTVNDVILSIVTAALRRYAELHNVSTARLLRIVVPVNVRGNGDLANLGNEITFVPVSIPLGIPEGSDLVNAVHDRMVLLKTARLGELVGLAATVFGAIPTPVQAFLGPIASQLPLSVCNTICTNVPGPQVPLYVAGRKILKMYPYVPIGGEMGMNCAILTYNGTAYFGFTGDTRAIPDVAVLEKFVAESFAALQNAVGVKPVRPPRKPPARKPAPVAKKTVRQVARRKKATAVAAEAPVQTEIEETPAALTEAPPQAAEPVHAPKAFAASAD